MTLMYAWPASSTLMGHRALRRGAAAFRQGEGCGRREGNARRGKEEELAEDGLHAAVRQDADPRAGDATVLIIY